MTNEVLSKTNWETVYKDDETLPAGTEKVTTTPYTGYKVKSYRNVYSADGKLISSTYEATSDYKVRNKVISRAPPCRSSPRHRSQAPQRHRWSRRSKPRRRPHPPRRHRKPPPWILLRSRPKHPRRRRPPNPDTSEQAA